MVAEESWSSSGKEALELMLQHKVDYQSSLTLTDVRIDFVASPEGVPLIKVVSDY